MLAFDARTVAWSNRTVDDERGEPEMIRLAAAGDRVALGRLLLAHYVRLLQYLEPRLPDDLRRVVSVEDVLQHTRGAPVAGRSGEEKTARRRGIDVALPEQPVTNPGEESTMNDDVRANGPCQPDHRTQRIHQTVDDCLQRWVAGETVSVASVLKAHPELLPELAPSYGESD
jgi:hypothetical protein